MLVVLILVGGVCADKDVAVRNFVDQDVVHETAMIVEQAGILSLALIEPGDGVGGECIGALDRSRSVNLDLAHVADIEQSDGLADSIVLVDDAGILDGHVPAAEIDHFGSHLAVYRIQRSSLERGGR